jgi:type IV pilus assembly protein PilY1
MKLPNRTRLSLAIASALGLHGVAHAQLIINDTLTGASSSYDWVSLNGACLTAGNNTGSIPACSGLAYYSGKTLVGGTTGRLPDVAGQGALRLTNGDTTSGGSNGDNQTGAVVSNFTFPTNEGIQVTWTSVTYGGDNLNNTGADGISFFLSDGSQSPTVGALGGSLGYSCSNGNGTYDGVVGGYLGVGIDEYGNFSNPGDNTDTGPGYKGGRISVRGAGFTAYSWLSASSTYGKYYPSTASSSTKADAIHNTCKSGYAYNYSGTTQKDSKGNNISNGNKTGDKLAYNYPILSYSDLPASVSIANQQGMNMPVRASAVPITYSLRITSDGLLDFSYSVNSGTAQTVISAQKITSSNGPLPASFRFGFSSGTGGGNNVHEITCFKAAPANESNSSAGSNVQQSARVMSGSQVYLAFYHPTNWWGQLSAQNLLYDTATDTLSVATTANWDGSCVLTGGSCQATGNNTVTAQTSANRNILSWSGTGGIPFQWSNLTSTQTAALTNGDASSTDARLRYLRGDRTGEVASGGSFRNRTGVLGDIVDSSPTWVGPPQSPYASVWRDKLQSTVTPPEGTSYTSFASTNATRQNVVYVGAGDGMMHGFRSGNFDSSGNFVSTNNDGKEVIAYVPNQVVSTIHSTTSSVDFANTQYSHNFFVDATPGTGDLYFQSAWHTWLVGGLGAGGQAAGPVDDPTATAAGSLFFMDVTDPSQFSEANASSLVITELTPATITSAGCTGVASNCGNYLGQTYGTPQIRRLHDGNWAVLWGNGLNSPNGTAGLFIMHINSTTGARTLQYIDTGYGSSKDPQHAAGRTDNKNGIVQITPADLDSDHITDYVYAGDFFGNVWRFDLTNSNPSLWSVRSAPIFSTPAGQPITTRVTVSGVATPSTNATKVLVSFGTGMKLPQTLTSAEVYATGTQYLYGVWDWDMSAWNGTSTDTKYDQLTGSQTVNAAALQTQTVTQTIAGSGDISGYRVLSSNAVCWKGSGACSNDQYGWKLALPTTTEQVVYNPVQSNGVFFVNTTIPANAQILTCSNTPASGYTMAVALGTGGAQSDSVFADASGSFTNTNISGIGASGTGTPSIMIAGQNYWIVQQTQKGTADDHKVKFTGGTGKRLNWTKIR